MSGRRGGAVSCSHRRSSFPRADSRVMMRRMSEQPGPDKYVETARDRRIANAVLLLFLVLIVGGGIWLANAMFDQRALDDCMAQGRSNCTPPIDAPAR